MLFTKSGFLNLTLLVLAILPFLCQSPVSARAIKIKPVKDFQTENMVMGLYRQARVAYKAGKKVDARMLLLKAAKFDETGMTPYLHKFLSRVYHDLGNPKEAVSEALTSLRYNPEQPELIHDLAIYSKEANRYQDAINFLNVYKAKASAKEKERVESLLTLLESEKTKANKFSPEGEDYLDKLTYEDNVNRWSQNKMPLKVFIERSSSAKGFRSIFPILVTESFVSWFRGSGEKLSFEFVNSKEDADITLEWTDKRLRVSNDKREMMKAGLTTSRTTESGELLHARIQIRTLNPFTKKEITEDRIKETCLHEIGHALGLNGHSTNHADIMYMGLAQRQLPALTKRDRATISKLYGSYKKVAMAGVKPLEIKSARVAGVPTGPSSIKTPKLNTAEFQNTQPSAMSTAMQPQPYPQQSAYPAQPYMMPGYQTGAPPQYYQQPPQVPAVAAPQTSYVAVPVTTYQYVPVQNMPIQPNYNYAPPVIPQQRAVPYPVAPMPMPPPQPMAMQQQAQQQNPVQAIDNLFQNLKPKIQQFLGAPQQQQQQSFPMQNQYQYPYQ